MAGRRVSEGPASMMGFLSGVAAPTRPAGTCPGSKLVRLIVPKTYFSMRNDQSPLPLHTIPKLAGYSHLI